MGVRASWFGQLGVIQNAYSYKVLDDPNSSTDDGTALTQYDYHGTKNQEWTFG